MRDLNLATCKEGWGGGCFVTHLVNSYSFWHVSILIIGFKDFFFFIISCFDVMQYLSNSALANTSVASTTVLTATSGLFTLLFGALLGQDSINITKVVAVFITMTGVAMTTIGKTWTPSELQSISEWVYCCLLISRRLL